jgi:hypothetical protein
MNAKQLATLCVGLGSAVMLAYTASTHAKRSVSLAITPQELRGLEVRPVQREYCFSETIEVMSCQDQLIMSAATGGPSATE